MSAVSSLRPWRRSRNRWHREDQTGWSVGTVEPRAGRWVGMALGGELRALPSLQVARLAVDLHLGRLGVGLRRVARRCVWPCAVVLVPLHEPIAVPRPWTPGGAA